MLSHDDERPADAHHRDPAQGGPAQGGPGDGEGSAAGDRLVRTGHPAVDATLATLDEVTALEPRQQVQRYGEAHAALRDTLRGIDEN